MICLFTADNAVFLTLFCCGSEDHIGFCAYWCFWWGCAREWVSVGLSKNTGLSVSKTVSSLKSNQDHKGVFVTTGTLRSIESVSNTPQATRSDLCFMQRGFCSVMHTAQNIWNFLVQPTVLLHSAAPPYCIPMAVPLGVLRVGRTSSECCCIKLPTLVLSNHLPLQVKKHFPTSSLTSKTVYCT